MRRDDQSIPVGTFSFVADGSSLARVGSDLRAMRRICVVSSSLGFSGTTGARAQLPIPLPKEVD